MVERGAEVSEPGTTITSEDELDHLVQRASVPSLASLFKAGKEKGLIKPTTGYGGAPQA